MHLFQLKLLYPTHMSNEWATLDQIQSILDSFPVAVNSMQNASGRARDKRPQSTYFIHGKATADGVFVVSGLPRIGFRRKWKSPKSQRRLYLGQCCVCVGRVSAKLCKWSISVMDPLDSNHGFESIILFLSQLRDNQQPKYSWQIFAFKSVSRLKSWAQQIHGRQNLLALPRD